MTVTGGVHAALSLPERTRGREPRTEDVAARRDAGRPKGPHGKWTHLTVAA